MTFQSKGINLIGYFHGSFGLSESARLIVESLKKSSIPFSLISADLLAQHHSQEAYKGSLNNDFIYPVNLFCVDPRHIFTLMAQYGWDSFKDRHNIALCFWETNVVPKTHLKPWSYLDEIWAPTRYVQEHLSIASSVPVYHISQPVQLSYLPTALQSIEKKNFGLEDKFTFLFSFCFYSVLGRKNPMAILESFKKAFPSRADVQLVIKSQNGSQYPSKFRSLLDSIKNDPRITWIDESISSQRRYDLMSACDCYISLHRSEGFGLTMAEAMLMGKPVIATGYSGNLDFMTEENSFLCNYRLQHIGSGHPPYSRKGIWADVDTDQAAHWMNYVFSNQEEAKATAQKGKETVLKSLSSEVVGGQIAHRLQSILQVRNGKPIPFPYKKAKLMKSVHEYIPFLRPTVKAAKKMVKKIVRNFK